MEPKELVKSDQGSSTGRREGADVEQDVCDMCRFLLFEVVAGTAVARIAAGEELVVLRRRADK